MESVPEANGVELKWTQPKALVPEFELCASDQLVATLRFIQQFNSFATVESTKGGWTFERIRAGVSIRQVDSNREIARFVPHWWRAGGTLNLENGRKLIISANFVETKYQIKEETGQPLIWLTTNGILHLSARVRVSPQAAHLTEVAWLVPFSWYLWLLSNQDAARTPVRRFFRIGPFEIK
jgi:hypothetical protein